MILWVLVYIQGVMEGHVYYGGQILTPVLSVSQSSERINVMELRADPAVW